MRCEHRKIEAAILALSSEQNAAVDVHFVVCVETSGSPEQLPSLQSIMLPSGDVRTYHLHAPTPTQIQALLRVPQDPRVHQVLAEYGIAPEL